MLISLRWVSDTVIDNLTGELMKWGEIPQRIQRKKYGRLCWTHRNKNQHIHPNPLSSSWSPRSSAGFPVSTHCLAHLPRPSFPPKWHWRQIPLKKLPHTWDFWGFLSPLMILLWISFFLVLLSLSLWMKEPVFIWTCEGLSVCSYPQLIDSHFDWSLIPARDANDRNFKHRSRSKEISAFGRVGLWLLLHPTVLVALSLISGQGFWWGLTAIPLSSWKPGQPKGARSTSLHFPKAILTIDLFPSSKAQLARKLLEFNQCSLGMDTSAFSLLENKERFREPIYWGQN